jgi:hypothetical protein
MRRRPELSNLLNSFSLGRARAVTRFSAFKSSFLVYSFARREVEPEMALANLGECPS